jgi:hypothetical protein
MKEKSSGDSTISECQKHLLPFWLGGLHLLTFLQFLVSHIQYLICQNEEIFYLYSEKGWRIILHNISLSFINAWINWIFINTSIHFTSLDGDARQWYFSLPHSSISSLKEFHSVFKEHYKRYFSIEFLFENCCEEFEKDIQHTVSVSSYYKAEIDVSVEEIKENSYLSFPSFPLLKVDFVGCSYDEENGNNAVHAFFLVTNVYKNHSSDDIVVPNVDKDQPILDEYSDDEEHFFTKAHTQLISSQPIYGNEEDKEELHQHFSLPPIDEHKSPRISELKQHMSSYGSYEDYHFVEKSVFIEEQDCLLKQLKVCHVLQDLVAIWMDSLLAKVPIVVTLGISLICSSECKCFLGTFAENITLFLYFLKEFPATSYFHQSTTFMAAVEVCLHLRKFVSWLE